MGDPRKLGQALRSWEEQSNYYLDHNLFTAKLMENILCLSYAEHDCCPRIYIRGSLTVALLSSRYDKRNVIGDVYNSVLI
jgi:hypothetical protein